MTVTGAESAADGLIRRAHGRAYRYPASFVGFEAELSWWTDDALGAARVVALPGPSIEIDGDEAAPGWVEKELRSIVGHRQASDYDEGDGRSAKRLAESSGHVLGDLVELEDQLGSSYRVSGDDISTVTRTMGGQRFTIVVHDRQEVAGGRAVPTSFTVFFWDAESGALQASEAYRDAVVEVGGLFLPAARRVVRADSTGLSVRELALSGHALLENGDRS